MSETPTARELVDSVLTGVVRTGYDGPDGISKDEALERSCVLAARVEAVLAFAKVRHASEAYDAALRDVLGILDGVKYAKEDYVVPPFSMGGEP